MPNQSLYESPVLGSLPGRCGVAGGVKLHLMDGLTVLFRIQLIQPVFGEADGFLRRRPAA